MITVTDNRSANRFEARDGETLAGFAAYLRTSTLVAFVHTEVDPAFEGRGVGSLLAREGIESVQAEAPDLILLDVMMPRMSGFEVCQ